MPDFSPPAFLRKLGSFENFSQLPVELFAYEEGYAFSLAKDIKDKMKVAQLRKFFSEIKKIETELEYLLIEFSVDIKYETDLNNRQISEELQEEFQKNGSPISQNFSLTRENDKWRIEDEKNQYEVIKQGRELKIRVFQKLHKDLKDKIALLMPELAYAKGRNLITEKFYDVMKESLIRLMKTKEDCKKFSQFLTAVIAYLKLIAR